MTKYTERMMLDLLHRRYSALSMGSRRYAVAEHVPDGQIGRGLARIADFIAQDCLNTWTRPDGRPAKLVNWKYDGEQRMQLHGHEIKVSRSDWLVELRDPSKAEAWKQYCDRWWLVAPRDIVKPEELPEGWGLLVPAGKNLRTVVTAPLLSPAVKPPLPMIMRATQATALKAASREAA